MINRLEYLLILAAEEAGEVSKEALKCIRFTTHNIDPVSGMRNFDKLKLEINDLMAALELLSEELGENIEPKVDPLKISRTMNYMQISRELGTLE